MTIDDRLLGSKPTFKLKLEFDPSKISGRRSLIWNQAAAIDYTGKLKSFQGISHRTEIELNSTSTADVQIALDNAASAPGDPGFWDTDRSGMDIAPLMKILCRLSMSVQESDGSWSAYAPLFTGIVHNVHTSLKSGQADMTARGVLSFLATEPASDVMNGDSLYEQLPVKRAVELLLTQRDRWAPVNGNDIVGSVVGHGASYVSVRRSSGLWYPDDAGLHPNGIHAGYVVVMTGGAAIGKQYPITSNELSEPSGSGFGCSICQVNGTPWADGVLDGDACYLTGFCWPYLRSELAGFTLDPVGWGQTTDGRPALSVVGRPPEETSLTFPEAIAHDGTYLWIGARRTDGAYFYRYNFGTDSYTQMQSLNAGYNIVRAFYWAAKAKIYWLTWNEIDTYTRSKVTATILSNPLGMTPGDPMTTEATILNFFPGDRHVRRGAPANIGGSLKRFIGRYCYTWTPEHEGINLQVPFSQRISSVDHVAGETAGCYWAKAVGPLSSTWHGADYTAGDFVYLDCDPWTYFSVLTVNEYVAAEKLAIQYHVGGAIQVSFVDWLADPNLQKNGIYYWQYDSTTGKHALRRWHPDYTDALVYQVTRKFEAPVCTWVDSSYLYVITEEWPNVDSSTPSMVMRLYRITLANWATVSTIWTTTANTTPANDILWVGASGGGGYGSASCMGCLMVGAEPNAVGYSQHQKFLLVRDINNAAFWTNFANGTNILYLSRQPFGHFSWHKADDTCWFVHAGYNTLWYGRQSAFGRAAVEPTVPGDYTCGSQICFSPDATYYSVYGISAGAFRRSLRDLPESGSNRLWAYSRKLAPRVEILPVESGSRVDKLQDIAEAFDCVFAADESATLSFKRRPDTSSPALTISDESSIYDAAKDDLEDEAFGRAVCTPTVPQFDPPKITFRAANSDDNGQPIAGKVFDGGIEVRMTNRARQRVIMTCVLGNAKKDNDAAVRAITDTYWTVFSPSHFPQWWPSNKSAQQYPDIWWNLGGWGVWVLLTNGEVGFVPGDQIIIDCPGVSAVQKADLKMTDEAAAAVGELKLLTYTVNNSLIPPVRGRQVCRRIILGYGVIPKLVTLTSKLRLAYSPLLTVGVTLARLGLSSMAGYVRQVTHDPFARPAKTTVQVRQWTLPAPASDQLLGAPLTAAEEPIDDTDG